MNLRSFAALLLLLLCAGCGHGHYVDFDGGVAAYKKGTPGSFDALSFRPLANPTSQKFAIDGSDPMVDVGESGKSFVKAFALPEANSGYHLVIRSYGMLHGLSGTALFYPLVTFLDADKKAISTSSPQDAMIDWGGAGSDEPDEPARVNVAFSIRPENPARYFIIHTAAAWIESGSAPSLEKPTMPAWAFVLLGAGALVTPADFPPSPIGLFQITIGPEQK